MASRVGILAAFVILCVPAVAQANGDPASDYLLVQSIFLPFNAKVDPDVRARLSDAIHEADNSGFRIKVAVIGSRYDLGTAFSLYNKPQKYCDFLGLELSFQYRGRLLVVMPSGFGVSNSGKSDVRGIRALKSTPDPGADVPKEVEAATAAVRRLAAAYGHVLTPSGGGGGSSSTRDRLTIAAGATALVALLAAIVLFRRGRTPARD